MNALEQQITRLYERGLTVRQIGRALEMSEYVVRGSLGIEEETKKKPAEKVVEKVVLEVPSGPSGAEVRLKIAEIQAATRLEAEKIKATAAIATAEARKSEPKLILSAPTGPVEKPPIDLSDDDELALEILRDIGRNRNASPQARVQAATILLDEKKGRRNLAADITKITGAAQLNEALKSLAARRDAAYAHLDVKEITVNEPTENT